MANKKGNEAVTLYQYVMQSYHKKCKPKMMTQYPK